MDWELRYPHWQRLLEAAVLEFNPSELCAKLEEVEAAVSIRLRELAAECGDHDERQALAKALLTIGLLGNLCIHISDSYTGCVDAV